MQQRYSLIVEPRGGLCNRLRVIEATVSFAKQYHLNPIIWWRKTYELAADATVLFSDIPFPIEESADALLYSAQWNALAMKARAIKAALQGYRVVTQAEITQLLLAGNDIAAIPQWQSRSLYIQTYSIYFQGLQPNYTWLQPSLEIRNSVQNTARLFLEKRVVGVHIRRGDHQQSKKNSKDEYFISMMKKELESHPETVFYLATDDLNEQRTIVDEFGDSIILRPKEFSRTSNEGVSDALADVLLLSKTQKIIGSYRSSFSETAAAIGGIPLVIAKGV